MTFLELYDEMRETTESFYVGKILVHLVEISDAVYNMSEAVDRIPGNIKTLQNPEVDPAAMKKFRVTYTINGREITNYLVALDKNEAKRMLFDFLEYKPKDRLHVVKSSQIVPVDNWRELVRLLNDSMTNDRKKGADKFQSLDNGDFHLMLTMVNKHPDFVKTHLATLPQDLQWYFRAAYNALFARNFGKVPRSLKDITSGNLDRDINTASNAPYWRNQVKSLVNDFGTNIHKKLQDIKTRKSPVPRKPAPAYDPYYEEEPEVCDQCRKPSPFCRCNPET